MKHPVRVILMPLFFMAIALISVGTLGDIGVSAASSTPAPKLVQPIKADPRTGAPIRNNSSSGTTKTTSSSTQKGQKTTTTTKTTKTTSKTVTKDLSANYTWQAQQDTNLCWAASGSVILTNTFGEPISQSFLDQYNPKGSNQTGGSPYLRLAFNDLQIQYGTNYSMHTTTNRNTVYNDIIDAIDNNHAVYLQTSYYKDSSPTNHSVVCVGYESDNKNNYRFYIYDPAPKDEKSGKYWTSTVNSNTKSYTVPAKTNSNNLNYANNYGTVTIKSCTYITK